MKTQTDSCILTLDDVRVVLGDRLLQAGGHDQTANVAECDVCVRELRALVLGLPWSDHPDGDTATATDRVGQGLNDGKWTTDKARTAACLPLALLSEADAPVGWVEKVVEQTIRQIMPIALRAAAAAHPDQAHRTALLAGASACETLGTKDAVMSAAAAVDAAYDADSGVAVGFAVGCAVEATRSAADAAGFAVAESAMRGRNAAAAVVAAVFSAADAAAYAAYDAGSDSAAAQDAVLAAAVRIVLLAHGRTDLVS